MTPFKNTLNICTLASGSKGNSVFLDGPDGALLVDAGLSAREIVKRIQTVGGDPGRIKAILVTHDHTDHVRGVRVLARRLSVPVFGTPGTLGATGLSESAPVRRILPGKEFNTAGFTVHPFSIPHDATDPVGFVLSLAGVRIGIATDLGCATALVKTRLENSDFLILEANHDEKMLMEGPYPWFLKQRIRSRMGHLSNEASAGILSELIHGGLRGVILAHLSEMNNRPDIALGAADEAADSKRNGLTITVAGVAEPTPVFKIELK